MRTWIGILLVSALLAQGGQRVKAVFGIVEGSIQTGGGFFSFIEEPSSLQITGMGPLTYNTRAWEPFGNDLAYDPRTKRVFLTGGGPNPFTYNGIIYAMKGWSGGGSFSYLIDSLTGPIGARRLAVKDTLLLVTRNRPPFFTAYRIRPTATGIALDSLWSPTSPYLRSVPEAIVVHRDTAFITLTYHPTSFDSDSLLLKINLVTRQVDSLCQVHPNPAELLRIGNRLYAACYGDFTGPLRIAEFDLATRSVTITNTGVGSFGGFVADTGGRDTILFISTSGEVRAYATQPRQVAPGAYRGLQAASGLTLYSLLWVGNWIFTSHTNFTQDTSVIVRYIQGLSPSPADTFRASIAALRRMIFVEEDATTLSYAETNITPFSVQLYPNPTVERFWIIGTEPKAVLLQDLTGRTLRTWTKTSDSYDISDLPAGLYIVRLQTEKAFLNLRLQKM